MNMKTNAKMAVRQTALIMAAWLIAGSAFGQGANIPFGGLKHDSALPVELAADGLTLNQETGTAEFKGNVVAGQGALRIGADALTIKYAGGSDAQGRQIEIMTASGNVTLTNGGEAAEADSAIYVVGDGRITMTGNVLLTQGDNALSGNKIVINLNTGQAAVEGRVRTIFQGADN